MPACLKVPRWWTATSSVDRGAQFPSEGLAQDSGGRALEELDTDLGAGRGPHEVGVAGAVAGEEGVEHGALVGPPAASSSPTLEEIDSVVVGYDTGGDG
jgi:hypothetical protein